MQGNRGAPGEGGAKRTFDNEIKDSRCHGNYRK